MKMKTRLFDDENSRVGRCRFYIRFCVILAGMGWGTRCHRAWLGWIEGWRWASQAYWAPCLTKHGFSWRLGGPATELHKPAKLSEVFALGVDVTFVPGGLMNERNEHLPASVNRTKYLPPMHQISGTNVLFGTLLIPSRHEKTHHHWFRLKTE